MVSARIVIFLLLSPQLTWWGYKDAMHIKGARGERWGGMNVASAKSCILSRCVQAFTTIGTVDHQDEDSSLRAYQ